MNGINTKSARLLLQKETGKPPLIIAGPCSAETEEQVMETGLRLWEAGCADIFRAGIWKPRTRPGSFEGVGIPGLAWLQQLKRHTGMPVAVEVATARQAEASLRAGIDLLWIGARTTVNPFSVQDVADALRGTDTPVLIKNPLNPDIDLWTGAVERFAAAGIQQLGLVHRGFYEYGNKTYRNAPIWPLALEMSLRHPDLLMINDPSHITGNSNMVSAVADKALNLGFDGLMIECHRDPGNAWSDAKQQITPEFLRTLLDEQRAGDEAVEAHEKSLKVEMSSLDEALQQLLRRRAQVLLQLDSASGN